MLFRSGGAANVARNVSALGTPTELFTVVGRDEAGERLKLLLEQQDVNCAGVLGVSARMTSIKSRIIAHRQQVVRVDRESRLPIDGPTTRRLMAAFPTGNPIPTCSGWR